MSVAPANAKQGGAWPPLENEIPLGTERSSRRGWKRMQTVKSRNLFGGGGRRGNLHSNRVRGITRRADRIRVSKPRLSILEPATAVTIISTVVVIGEFEIHRGILSPLEDNDKRARCNFLELFQAADLTR